MALLTKVGSFNKKTSTGAQAITGIGFTPKALIFFSSKQTSVGLAADDFDMNIGISDGTTDRAISGFSLDAKAFTATASRRHANKIITFHTKDGGVDGEADLTSFDADGFTLDWTVADANGYVINYLALGGDDLTDVNVGTFNLNTSTGNQGITGVGFQPDFTFFLVGANPNNAPNTISSMVHGIGAAISSTARVANSVNSGHTASDGDTDRDQQTDHCIIENNTTSPGRGAADFVSMDADGFTINIDNAPPAGDKVHYLALKGGQYFVGSETQKTSTGTKATTGVGFTPKALFFSSHNRAVGSGVHARLSFGASGAVGEEGSNWAGHTDTVDPMSCDKLTSTTKCLSLIDTDAPSGVDAEADLSSYDGDGFTLDWTTADAAAREFIFWAMGSSTPTGPSANEAAHCYVF